MSPRGPQGLCFELYRLFQQAADAAEVCTNPIYIAMLHEGEMSPTAIGTQAGRSSGTTMSHLQGFNLDENAAG